VAERLSAAPTGTAYTYEFVTGALPEGAANILEVGCGAGELAARLVEAGLRVLALDSDPDCVAAARAAGVEARLARWPVAVGERFDAVLFTRSLHHIAPLEEAVAAAVEALHPSGRIIVEDFRAEGGSERSRAWYARLVRGLHSSGGLQAADVSALLAKTDPDDHELHPSAAIATALARFGDVEQSDAAYYFRYLEPKLPQPAASELLKAELAVIESGSIDALGKRFVLSPGQ